jgi:hypothetical protein
VSRGRLLAPVWAAANDYQDAQDPSRPAIIVGTATQAWFLTLLNSFGGVQQTVATGVEALDRARGALRRAARELETLCIRFLKAAKGIAEPGSAAEEALDTIPTETTSNLPETLGIRTFSQGGQGGLQLLVAYEPYSLEPGETAVLQYKRVDQDADWLETPYDASGNALGPFAVGQTVQVRTRVTNASGSREGGTRQLTLIAPPV